MGHDSGQAGGPRGRRSVPAAPFLAFLLALLVSASGLAQESAIIRSGPRSSGAVALTFDDGWGQAACARIAHALRTTGARATFFINGNHLKAEPELWKQILGDMPVANHTRSHLDLVEQDDRVVRKQIREDEAIHERLLGRPMLKLFRPPYGSHDRRVRTIAAELGYRYTVLWSHSSGDTSNAADARSIVRRATGAPPGSIILLHCAHDATAEAMPAIIRHYQSRGIRLVGLDELFDMSPPPTVGPTWLLGQDRVLGLSLLVLPAPGPSLAVLPEDDWGSLPEWVSDPGDADVGY
jgi:peptidoglycan/xylan/chitin deacetylase (PgdA/CDA1 family)